MKWKKRILPNPSKNSEDSLYLDVVVYTEIEDILNNRDAQIEALRELIK